MAIAIIEAVEEINLSEASDEDIEFFRKCHSALGTDFTVNRNGNDFHVVGIEVTNGDFVTCKIRFIKKPNNNLRDS